MPGTAKRRDGDWEASRKDTLSMLAHDLKAPLTVIEGFAYLLRERNPSLPGEDREMLRLIKKAAETAIELVEDFLILSKVESGKLNLQPAPASLTTLVDFHLDMFRAAAGERDINIHSDIPDEMPHAFIDEKLSGRVLSNLLSNAVKYSGKGGRVCVRAGIHEDDPSKVFLEVSDSGPGIPEHILPHLFEKYHGGSCVRDDHGTGLGLAIVKALTNIQGGTVEARSEAGQGTTIKVVLPAAPSDS